ncbi:uncharacterized protein EI97DRAFT_423663 [Westerdykella ornata]|uniref:Wax synthase domain-containing protein n=1 Tax=Westerdykella ornata TaxID=318751 RepID=A0A6A6JC41_WESOR|nr:uncharacterized protein EI97DRAFT_423663 [Westerdykella ornata]KAF2273845.1 hypothetical protein EI97DRAFT_423663 [Westerdykella ornata]
MSPWAPEPPWHQLHSHHDVTAYYHRQYDECVRAGTCTPFTYPFASLGTLVAILYLLIPHRDRPWLRRARFLVWAWMAAFSTYTIAGTKARGMAPAFGVGVVSSWGVIWVGTILVVHDAQTEFKRIERRSRVLENEREGDETGSAQANGSHDHVLDSTADETAENIGNGHSRELKGTISGQQKEYFWQSYPTHDFRQRLNWVLDIFSNFRGVGWNWRPASIPPPPSFIQAQLTAPFIDYKPHPSPSHISHHHHHHRSHNPRHPPTPVLTRRTLLLQNLKLFLTGYLIIDALKTLMNHDPYFWGHLSSPAPSYLPTLPPILLRTYRLALTQLTIQYTLQTLFSLSPLLFCGLLSSSTGTRASQPWMYPPTFGPYSLVLDRGVAGWWGQWWHQTFRFAFDAPGRKLVALWGWQQRSRKARFVRVVVAFALSGVLHAAGSFTAAGRTRPVGRAMLFFVLQPVGLGVEATESRRGGHVHVHVHVPRAWKRVCRWLYVHAWFYLTGPLLCDDFATSGVWLFEPVPVSLFRGLLGWGVEGDGVWCWGRGRWNGDAGRGMVWWHSGERWWMSGFAW